MKIKNKYLQLLILLIVLFLILNIVLLVLKIINEILTKGHSLKGLLPTVKGNRVPEEIRLLEFEIEGLMMELEDLGCYFKDWNFEIGLVDFPARIHGEEVLLCWRSDERHIRWYHSIEDGYPGRRLIPENLLEE